MYIKRLVLYSGLVPVQLITEKPIQFIGCADYNLKKFIKDNDVKNIVAVGKNERVFIKGSDYRGIEQICDSKARITGYVHMSKIVIHKRIMYNNKTVGYEVTLYIVTDGGNIASKHHYFVKPALLQALLTYYGQHYYIPDIRYDRREQYYQLDEFPKLVKYKHPSQLITTEVKTLELTRNLFLQYPSKEELREFI